MVVYINKNRLVNFIAILILALLLILPNPNDIYAERELTNKEKNALKKKPSILGDGGLGIYEGQDTVFDEIKSLIGGTTAKDEREKAAAEKAAAEKAALEKAAAEKAAAEKAAAEKAAAEKAAAEKAALEKAAAEKAAAERAIAEKTAAEKAALEKSDTSYVNEEKTVDEDEPKTTIEIQLPQ